MIDRAVKLLRLAEDTILVSSLSIMIGLAAYQVIARNFFDTGILWGDSLVRVLVLWITFAGATVASRKDEHIRMDLLSRFLDRRWNRFLRRITSAFTSLVCGLFAYHAARFVILDYQDGMVAFASVPAWLCELIMPVGAGVLCLRYLLHVVKPP